MICWCWLCFIDPEWYRSFTKNLSMKPWPGPMITNIFHVKVNVCWQRFSKLGIFFNRSGATGQSKAMLKNICWLAYISASISLNNQDSGCYWAPVFVRAHHTELFRLSTCYPTPIYVTDPNMSMNPGSLNPGMRWTEYRVMGLCYSTFTSNCHETHIVQLPGQLDILKGLPLR